LQVLGVPDGDAVGDVVGDAFGDAFGCAIALKVGLNRSEPITIIIVVNPQVSDRKKAEQVVLLKSFVFTIIFLCHFYSILFCHIIYPKKCFP
jgi:hypothetical protein